MNEQETLGKAATSGISGHLIREIVLPAASTGVEPLLHSVVSDPRGDIYMTDEVNDRVLSFSRGGANRWCLGGRGNGECQFWYPRGLAIG